MMLRRALAVAVLLAAPAAARAQANLDPRQTGPQLPYARFAITPFVGLRAPSTGADEHLYFDGETVSTTSVSRERGGAVLGGVEAEYRFARQWSAVGSYAMSARGTDVVSTTDGSSTESVSEHGSRFSFAKLGVSYRIPDPAVDSRRFHPGGFIVVAPAWVRMEREGFDAVNNKAINLGIAATAPIGASQRLAFQIGIDDYLTWWDTDKLEAQDAALFTTPTQTAEVDFGSSTGNIFVIRLGGSFRF